MKTNLVRPNTLAQTQAAYFALTGIWPLIPSTPSSPSPAATPTSGSSKPSALSSPSSVSSSPWPRASRVTPEIRLLAAGTALTLALVDIVYVANRRIRPVYLLDALPELTLAALWLRANRAAR